MMRFKDLYEKHITKSLQSKFNYVNPMQMPKILKISINMGVGEAVADSKIINNAANDLAAIAAQKPVLTSAKKSISTFKLRENMNIGCKVTLRKQKMYSYLERLVLIALPRVRDFRGFTMKSFDGNGNFSFGLKEQILFPEIHYDKVDVTRGMDVTIVTSAKTDAEAKELLAGFYLPFVGN
ncbi:50S ribosomal protein L5 [Candidatus Arcanobacter lacustris]|jgi:large subunit ribosomal protein L5|uniref:Large ribosomal subunit protein uL5 n=1 Tax=Candidatus Arcanibacter lacustris TaxID=1607817 RepID=A0A0F5MPD8_9RICK|nr:50S ribosomal protein L5 [Candidatus Arcanobacter lacustris]